MGKVTVVSGIISDRTLHRDRLAAREQSHERGWRKIEWSEVEATMAMLSDPVEGVVIADAVNSVDANVALVSNALDDLSAER